MEGLALRAPFLDSRFRGNDEVERGWSEWGCGWRRL